LTSIILEEGIFNLLQEDIPLEEKEMKPELKREIEQTKQLNNVLEILGWTYEDLKDKMGISLIDLSLLERAHLIDMLRIEARNPGTFQF